MIMKIVQYIATATDEDFSIQRTMQYYMIKLLLLIPLKIDIVAVLNNQDKS